MCIRDEEMCLLARVPRSVGRLYVLDINLACPMCLAAHTDKDTWLWHA